jgi:hypothetical protein
MFANIPHPQNWINDVDLQMAVSIHDVSELLRTIVVRFIETETSGMTTDCDFNHIFRLWYPLPQAKKVWTEFESWSSQNITWYIWTYFIT